MAAPPQNSAASFTSGGRADRGSLFATPGGRALSGRWLRRSPASGQGRWTSVTFEPGGRLLAQRQDQRVVAYHYTFYDASDSMTMIYISADPGGRTLRTAVMYWDGPDRLMVNDLDDYGPSYWVRQRAA
ncbi:MAG: hypothetical protein AB1814_00030 [Thermodesulfobacteriota bacterium]